MFFNQAGKQAESTAVPCNQERTPADRRRSADAADARRQQARRRTVALGMAVQLAVPVTGLVGWARSARAAGPSASAAKTAAPASPAEAALRQLFGTAADGSAAVPAVADHGPGGAAYDKAVELLRAGQYADAVVALKAIAPEALDQADGTRVDEVLGKANTAARQQRNARAELSVAQQSAAAGHSADAAKRYGSVAANVFADDDTRRQAADGATRLAAAGPVAAPINAVVLAAATEQQQPAPDLVPAGPGNTAPVTAPAPSVVPGSPSLSPTNAEPMPAPAPAPVAPAPAPAPTYQPPTYQPPAYQPPAVAPAASGSDARRALQGAADYERIKRQQQQYAATKLVESAKKEYAANQKQDALRDYSRAADLDPENSAAVSGRNEVSTELGLGRRDDLAPTRNVIDARIESIRYRFNSEINNANENIAANKFAEAQRNIENATVARNTDPTLFTTPQLNQFDTTIQSAKVSLETARSGARNRETESAAGKTLEQEAVRRQRVELQKQRTVESLIQSARHYGDQGQYRQQLATVDQILRVDPTNEYALGVRQLVLDKATGLEQRQYIDQYNREVEKVYNAGLEAEIPYSDIVHYSDDWPTLSEMRDNEVKADRGEADEDSALQAQLNRHLPEVRFNANALTDVIDFLRDVSGANIYVDWKALEAANIAKDAPVTARLRDVKFSKALEVIFKNVEGDDDEHRLGYTVDEGVITISTRKDLNKNTITRRYDINDLLFVAPDYGGAPQLNLQSAGQGQSAGGGGGGGGGGQSLFSGQGQQQNQDQSADRGNRIDEIKQYIQQNVDPNSWKDNGGEVGSVSSSPLRAILLVTQTPENQRKIVSVLDSLRASQALQVSIETRFLTVQRNYLEDIGVDTDLTFNPLRNPADPRSGYNSSRFSPITIAQNQVSDNSTFVDANGNVANQQTGSRTLDWVSGVGNGAVPGSIAANPADYPNPIVIRGSYLDNLTVSFLIRAVEANQNTTSLTAPRLTLFSGQRALLVVQTQQAYVSDLTPVVAPGAALFDPQVSTTVATGVVLSVQATVSPDRKYVFMNLEPQLARLRALAQFSVSAVVTPTATNNGGATGASQIIQGTIQLPTIDVTQVRTSCSVPDGATLLLGGQTLAAESVREQGVPVLSKIPFLKRLFTNRAASQDEQVLLILVKPTILIQREQEQRQFPQLSTKMNGSGT